jgi:hypothetical protein
MTAPRPGDDFTVPSRGREILGIGVAGRSFTQVQIVAEAFRNFRMNRDGLDRYAVTVGLVLSSVALRYLLDPVLGARFPYTTFYPAVLLAAYVFGRNAGLLAIVCSALVAYVSFVDPGLRLGLSAPALLGLVMFAANGVIAVLIISDLLDLSSRISDELHRTEKNLLENAARLDRLHRCGAP